VFSPPVLAALGERPIITVDVEIELGLVIVLLVDVPQSPNSLQTMAAEAPVAVKARTPTIPKTALPIRFIIVSSQLMES
jgi:hypothetical protein